MQRVGKRLHTHKYFLCKACSTARGKHICVHSMQHGSKGWGGEQYQHRAQCVCETSSQRARLGMEACIPILRVGRAGARIPESRNMACVQVMVHVACRTHSGTWHKPACMHALLARSRSECKLVNFLSSDRIWKTRRWVSLSSFPWHWLLLLFKTEGHLMCTQCCRNRQGIDKDMGLIYFWVNCCWRVSGTVQIKFHHATPVPIYFWIYNCYLF